MSKIIFKGFKEPKVIDENGKELISFKESKSLLTHSSYSVMNANNEKIGKIERSGNNSGLFGIVDLPQIVISINDDKMTLQRDMKELKDIYEMTGNGFSITGSWKGPHFTISKNEQLVASIDVQYEEEGRIYLIDIVDNANEAQVLCILFAISWII